MVRRFQSVHVPADFLAMLQALRDQGMSNADIAKAVGISEQAIKNILYAERLPSGWNEAFAFLDLHARVCHTQHIPRIH